jgi:hypothetical protein
MVDLATSVQVNGLHGVLLVLAVILFLIAAIVAWFVEPRARWATLVSAGLCLTALSFIITS